jgi:hypothetical protein
MDYEKNLHYLRSASADQITEAAISGKPRSGLGSRAIDREPLEVEEPDLQNKYMGFIKGMRPEKTEVEELGPDPEVGLEQRVTVDEEGNETVRPQSRRDIAPEGIRDDPAFQEQVQRLVKKYGIDEAELYRVIKGESGFNPKAQNKSGASGLFQFMPEVAAEYGFTTDEVLGMAPAEQVALYDQYLSRWGYDGSNSLGIMQGAPAFANKSDDTVVYKKGSAAWKQNKGWRPKGGGDITVGSMNQYYRNQG